MSAVTRSARARSRSRWALARRRSSCCSIAVRVALARPDGRAVDHGRRARLLRAREELRGDTGSSSSAACRTQRLRVRLPGADRARVAALHLDSRPPTPRRRRSTRVLMSLAAIPRTSSPGASCPPAARARRRAAHRRRAVDALHRDADDRERVLPALRAARARARRRARAADRGSQTSRLLVVSATRVRDPCAGGRARAQRSLTAPLARRSRRAPAARVTRAPTAVRGRGRRWRCACRRRRGRARALLRSLLGAYARDALELRPGHGSSAGSSTTSRSSTSTSAIVPCSRRCSLCVRARAHACRARRRRGRSRSSSGSAIEVAAFATQRRPPDRGAQHVLRRAARSSSRSRPVDRARLAARRASRRGRAAVAVVALAAVIPYSGFIDTSATSDTFGCSCSGGGAVTQLIHAAGRPLGRRSGVAVICLAIALFLPRRAALGSAAARARRLLRRPSQPVERPARDPQASLGALFAGITRPRSRLDRPRSSARATPNRRRCSGPAARPTSRPADRGRERVLQPRASARLRPSTAPVPGGLPETPITLDRDNGRSRRERPISSTYATCSPTRRCRSPGRRIGADVKNGARPATASTARSCVRYDDERHLRRHVVRAARSTYRRFACGGRHRSTSSSAATRRSTTRRRASTATTVAGRSVAHASVPPKRGRDAATFRSAAALRRPLHRRAHARCRRARRDRHAPARRPLPRVRTSP